MKCCQKEKVVPQNLKSPAENCNHAAERKFGVAEKVVSDWQKAEVTLTATKEKLITLMVD